MSGDHLCTSSQHPPPSTSFADRVGRGKHTYGGCVRKELGGREAYAQMAEGEGVEVGHVSLLETNRINTGWRKESCAHDQLLSTKTHTHTHTLRAESGRVALTEVGLDQAS